MEKGEWNGLGWEVCGGGVAGEKKEKEKRREQFQTFSRVHRENAIQGLINY